MINLVEVRKGKRYPFLFDMEVVWFLTASGKIDIDTKENGETKITADYNDMMEMFLIANRSAIEYEGKGAELTIKELKNGIRDNPKLFVDLQNLLTDSGVLKMFEEIREEDDKKKPSPGKKSGK